MWESIRRYLVNVFTGGRGWHAVEREASELIARARKLGPRYTLVKPFDESSSDYIRIMADIGGSMEFRWLLMQIRERAVSNLIDKPMDGVAVNIGVVMTVEEISRRLNEYMAQNRENKTTVNG